MAPESDDQEQQFTTPLTQKPVLMIDGINSAMTLITSPSSSRKSPCSSKMSFNGERSVAFNDYLQTFVVDCEYTDEQIGQLWFTKTEYDDFLNACDDEAQKCEAHEKEMRVAKLKKEIRKQRRQRRKEEKQRTNPDQINKAGPENNIMDLDMDDDIADDSLHGDNIELSNDYAKKDSEEGSLCSLGLEAWTLEGYQTREYHRQKAIDAILKTQYKAWDEGLQENLEMMSAKYFAASATSVHSATKKGKQLEDDVKEYMVISTLDDYNRTVQALNVLQKSLTHLRNMRDTPKPSTTKANRRCSNEMTKTNRRASNASMKMNRRGSDESMKMNRRGSNENMKMNRRSSIDRTLAVTDAANDVAPRHPKNDLTEGELALKSGTTKKASGPPPPASSSMTRKKFKPRSSKISGTPHKIYKSKAMTNIIVAPPTPPVVKARRVSYKAGALKPEMMELPMTTTNNNPKSQNISNKLSTGGISKPQESSKSMKSSKSSNTESKNKAKKSKKEPKSQPQGSQPSRRRSISPGPTGYKGTSLSPGRLGDKDRGRSPGQLGDKDRGRSLGQFGDKDRGKSPRRVKTPATSRSRSPGQLGDNRSTSPGPIGEKHRRKFRSKSPRPSAKSTKVATKILRGMKKVDKNAPAVESVTSVTVENQSSISTHSSSHQKSPKKEHWWFSQQTPTPIQ